MKFFVIATAFLLASPSAFGAQAIIGRAAVVDGDTIDISGTRIRLNGIDAPESWQKCRREDGSEYRCGAAAAFALDEFLTASRPTRCEQVDIDRYHRIVANCFRADGKSVNAWLVRTGNAVDWVRYSHGAFAADQNTARASRIGIWQGRFDLPCEARASRSHQGATC
ncbi:nuclease (SNase domain protein) [Rhizobium leguminosarum bv. trifolii WSM2304]|uniref:Nuclease (SNase domain protein) n=1 Tax=Rhizobium leguminosarum bv. trifolii (strain WSM2304) TaxID=395492 RepID=A0ABF7QT63_RHILW|nr:thermonuclease family protein [Rhizobium leguminosarum]ACI57415.1 nuclease (SNase domain protein) [Rhizobium leguminosarum bv. trifolii WSM2304]